MRRRTENDYLIRTFIDNEKFSKKMGLINNIIKYCNNKSDLFFSFNFEVLDVSNSLIKLPSTGTIEEVGCVACPKCLLKLRQGNFIVYMKCLYGDISLKSVSLEEPNSVTLTHYPQTETYFEEKGTYVKCPNSDTNIDYSDWTQIWNKQLNPQIIHITSPVISKVKTSTEPSIHNKPMNFENHQFGKLVNVTKFVRFVARTSKGNPFERDLLRSKSTSWKHKEKICKMYMMFPSYFSDQNNINWNVMSTKFVNATANDYHLMCKTELVVNTQINNKSYEKALEVPREFSGFHDTIEIVDITQAIMKKPRSKNFWKWFGLMVCFGAIILLCLCTITIVWCPFNCGKPKKPARHITIQNDHEVMVKKLSNSTDAYAYYQYSISTI
ncbi:hypothetical protein SNEBB_011257 [Seison nebaliae]|nr:hypothetical protein SNEBB_011257 [Seison nebaliae]